MYIVIRNDLVIYKGDSLQEFLHDKFAIKIIDGKVFIRPFQYEFYLNKEYEEMSISYSKEFKEEFIFKEFLKTQFIGYAKKYDYEFYKCEKI